MGQGEDMLSRQEERKEKREEEERGRGGGGGCGSDVGILWSASIGGSSEWPSHSHLSASQRKDERKRRRMWKGMRRRKER